MVSRLQEGLTGSRPTRQPKAVGPVSGSHCIEKNAMNATKPVRLTDLLIHNAPRPGSGLTSLRFDGSFRFHQVRQILAGEQGGMAGGPMVGMDLAEFRDVDGTTVESNRASGTEPAA